MTDHDLTATRTPHGWHLRCDQCSRHVFVAPTGVTVIAAGDPAALHTWALPGFGLGTDAQAVVELDPAVWGEGCNA